uniref:Ig-like domain-containing protein n=1 Tax=Anopheles albimanus TaxID=7167 RepID=A0A182FS08_ANOAL
PKKAHVFTFLLLPVLNIISGEVQSYWEQPFAQPYFDNSTKREVTATVGQSALLHCRVRNLGDRAVSWIRKRDLHILTVGILTYTNDQRFQSLHTEGSDEWTLRITSPQPRDSGTYECQVSTEPKISQAFRLNVVGKYITMAARVSGQPGATGGLPRLCHPYPQPQLLLLLLLLSIKRTDYLNKIQHAPMPR